ncbi:MAG: tryptophan-rich sensory protein [Xanthomonadales bacterium]|nr:tryptophan-rich sensory protein [Xanthomonadales bacterium]
MRAWPSLLLFIALVAIAAVAGAFFPPDAWYANLVKPSFNPPNAVFAPAWTILYLAMAVAAWRIHRIEGWRLPLSVWLAQLVLNAIWTPLFFGLHDAKLALVDLVVLDALVIWTTVLFFRRDRLAGFLMLLYLGWLAFATTLNAAIVSLNPGA